MESKIHEFLMEDLGSGDITSELTVPAGVAAKGRIVCKQNCILAGATEAIAVFRELGATAVEIVPDGRPVKKGQIVLEVKGKARQLLAGERLALNFLMRMSGIATLTSQLIRQCSAVNPKIRIAATRKTTPGFREFEKKAVMLGGGDPHRSGLYDAILIKDNHIRIAGGIREALSRAQKGSFTKKIEIEAENRADAIAAVEGGADIILLDNLSPREVKRIADELRKKRPEILIEASGGITPETVAAYAAGADIISLGWLTHSVRSVDFSMDIEKG